MKVILLQFTQKLMNVVPALALMLALQSVSATCFFLLHQPDIPEELK